jgi:hypothetical protein
MALVEGVSLGSLAYQPPGPATGYVAFATTLLFLGGIAALPHGGDDSEALVVTGDIVDTDTAYGSRQIARPGVRPDAG